MARKDSGFYGRSREIGQIRSWLDRQDPVTIRVSGIRGVGKSALVERAVQDFSHVIVRMPALPEPLQRSVLMESLDQNTEGTADESPEEPSSHPSSWARLFSQAAGQARPGRAPFVLILDDAHRLTEARARFEKPLASVMDLAREGRRAFHVILVGLPPDDATDDETLVVPPLPLRAAVPMLPGGTPRQLLRAYGALGGIPEVLRKVDRSLTLETNIRKLMIERGAPFADAPGLWLERDLQTTSRYNAVLTRLALGEADWGSLRAAIPDLTSSGQLAPYVGRLEELGLVRVRRSLDAAPRSRSQRYRLADPCVAFWYRFVHPTTWGLPRGASPEALVRAIRPDLDAYMEDIFPEICRQHMQYDALETLGANARELGSLWAPEYEIPVAGLLTSGAAFYGTSIWGDLRRDRDPLDALDAAARETRYGFGREHRIRLLFTSTDPPRWLERATVRRDQSLLIGPRQLVGT
jgi:AAA+ ATPase superfamily predicted ATPase